MLLQKFIYPVILGPLPLFLFSFHMVFWGPFWHSVDSSVGRDEACTNFAQLRRIKNGGVDIILGRSNMLNMQVALNFPPNIFIYIVPTLGLIYKFSGCFGCRIPINRIKKVFAYKSMLHKGNCRPIFVCFQNEIVESMYK